MTFEGAVIREQGVTFAVVVVNRSVLENRPRADDVIAAFSSTVFPGTPVVLMAQDNRGIPTYYGRKDIVDFMSRVPLKAVKWKRYTVNT